MSLLVLARSRPIPSTRPLSPSLGRELKTEIRAGPIPGPSGARDLLDRQTQRGISQPEIVDTYALRHQIRCFGECYTVLDLSMGFPCFTAYEQVGCFLMREAWIAIYDQWSVLAQFVLDGAA
jgi:hypothetical protein